MCCIFSAHCGFLLYARYEWSCFLFFVVSLAYGMYEIFHAISHKFRFYVLPLRHESNILDFGLPPLFLLCMKLFMLSVIVLAIWIKTFLILGFCPLCLVCMKFLMPSVLSLGCMHWRCDTKHIIRCAWYVWNFVCHQS